MTGYDRVLTAVHHERPDRPAMDLSAIGDVQHALMAYLDLSDSEALRSHLGIDFRHFWPGVNKAQMVPEKIKNRYGRDSEIQVDHYGVVYVKHRSFPQSHRVYGPFYDTRDLDSFDWPTPDDVEEPEHMAQEIGRRNAAGTCSVIHYSNPFKMAFFMRRFEDFMEDCVLDPDYVVELMRRIAAIELRRAENGVKAGGHCAMVYGDFADQRSLMVSPATFRKVLKPILVDFVAHLKRIRSDVLVFLHSDGNLMPVLPDLIECGFQAVHPIQPECMDMQTVKRLYGKELTLFGGVSVQTELPSSTPDAIRVLVRARIDQLGSDGGFILAPSNTILTDVPLECILAMYQEGAAIHN